ncbi:TolC family protein [Vandammella animalimorsus]|uniref:TolC family protein n=2 Tax=Vandammella animalimorsus TaxID=2029117 RepID=UPI0031B9AD7E
MCSAHCCATPMRPSMSADKKRPMRPRDLAVSMWLLLALPGLVTAQEAYGGPEDGMPLKPAYAPPQKAVGASQRHWRERLTPLQDPVRTEPATLRQPLVVPLPPDLLTSSPHAQLEENNVGILIPGQWHCATRSSAPHPEHPQWALQTLLADQPISDRNAEASSAIPVLTLPTAIRLALCHNPQVRASWSAIAQQAAQVGQARSAYWPQLNAGIGRQRSRRSYSGEPPAPAHATYATTQNAALSWRLWDFGARDARTDAALAQLQAALHTQNATVQKALAQVLHAYGEAQAAQARLETQHRLLPLAERSVKAAQRRQQGGAGSQHDTLQAIAAQARVQLEQSRSQGELDKATAQLNYLLGLPSATVFQLESIEPKASPGNEASANVFTYQPLAQSLDDWLQQARESHPAILAARSQWQAAQASLKAVQSEGLPTLDFSMAHYRNGRPNTALTDSRSRENVIGLTLSIPIFDGFNTTYKVRASQALVEQKAIEYQAAAQQTLHELVQLHAEAKATLNNLRMASSLFAVAEKAAHSTQRQYDKGAADILQLNQSLTNLQHAQQEFARSQTEWNRARLKLWLQAGAMPPTP